MKPASGRIKLDVQSIREVFPVLSRQIRPGIPLIYLDSAATSQKPKRVLEAMMDYYQERNANIHRGIHQLAEEATAAYESARELVASFIGAPSPKQVIFTRNTTEAINLVAQAWGRSQLDPGDLVVLTEMEHHSNLIPWQMLALEKDLRLEFVPVTEGGLLDMQQYHHLLEQDPSLVAFTHVSNVLGTINPVKDMVASAKQTGAVVLVDGAQAVPHRPVDVAGLGVDFYAFSAHKMCGPTGIGVLYGRMDLLKAMPPYQGGGEMIRRVGFRDFEPSDLPHKFEAGTPAIAEAMGFGAAVDFLLGVGMEAIHEHERELVEYALERLEEVPGLRVFGPRADHRGGVAAFTLEGVHAHDVAQILDGDGIAVRAGHHCAMPLHGKFNLAATTRASFYLYNTHQEIDRLIDGLYKVKTIFN